MQTTGSYLHFQSWKPTLSKAAQIVQFASQDAAEVVIYVVQLIFLILLFHIFAKFLQQGITEAAVFVCFVQTSHPKNKPSQIVAVRQNFAIGTISKISALAVHYCKSLSRKSEFMSRLSKLKFSARLFISGLNPDAARPLARLMSRFSRPYVQTFQTQTLGATRQCGSKSRCGATLGANHVQTFQTLCPIFPHSKSRRNYAI